MKNQDNLTLAERVYLERTRQFYSNGLGNIIGALLAAFLLYLIFQDANVPSIIIISWLVIFLIFDCIVAITEYRFTKIKLTVSNANRLVMARIISGGFVGLIFGLTPLLLLSTETVSLLHPLLIFIILIAIIATASPALTVMPVHFIILTSTCMVPITIFLFFQSETLHTILAVISIAFQFSVTAKVLRVSKTTINSILIYEQLEDEIKEHKRTKEKLKYMATYDSLTGLPNRKLLMDRLDVIVKQAKRNKQSIAVMFLDLDGFKNINDEHGHKAGDLLLQEVANRLIEQARESDTVARLGGDEFVLICPDLSKNYQEISTLAQRIISSLSKPISLAHNTFAQISASIGIAIYPNDSSNAEELLISADEAMYRVKKDGKNHFAYASAD